jgi:hypothetical protein
MDKFVYAMTGFDPADFAEIDFSDMIAIAEKEDVNKYYFSEVIFVRQDETDLTFETVNGSDSKTMQVKKAPSGLSAGQQVRIYYSVSIRHYFQRMAGMNWPMLSEAWGVYAIEQL